MHQVSWVTLSNLDILVTVLIWVLCVLQAFGRLGAIWHPGHHFDLVHVCAPSVLGNLEKLHLGHSLALACVCTKRLGQPGHPGRLFVLVHQASWATLSKLDIFLVITLIWVLCVHHASWATLSNLDILVTILT